MDSVVFRTILLDVEPFTDFPMMCSNISVKILAVSASEEHKDGNWPAPTRDRVCVKSACEG